MLVDVEALARYELVVPRQLAGVDVHRQHRIGVEERLAVGFSTALAMPRFGLRRAPERQMKAGVISTCNPRIPTASAAFLRRETCPRVAARFTRIGRRVKPPDS